MRHKECGGEIVLWINNKDERWHPWFLGYCPKCDVAVRPNEVIKEAER